MAGINDLVLVHIDDKPAFYARIEGIVPDVKPAWWQVKLLVLTFPLQVYTWILDESQLGGAPFTMGGTPVLLERVESPPARDESPPVPRPGSPPSTGKGSVAKVVSLADRKKEK
jgi:hypothetical protein